MKECLEIHRVFRGADEIRGTGSDEARVSQMEEANMKTVDSGSLDLLGKPVSRCHLTAR